MGVEGEFGMGLLGDSVMQKQQEQTATGGTRWAGKGSAGGIFILNSLPPDEG